MFTALLIAAFSPKFEPLPGTVGGGTRNVPIVRQSEVAVKLQPSRKRPAPRDSWSGSSRLVG